MLWLALLMRKPGACNESEQSTLGKGRFYPHCAIDERKRRGSREHTRDHKGAQGAGSGMRRRDDGFAGGTLGAEVLGVDIASNLVAAGRQRAIAEGLGNCKFQEGDASNLHDLKDRSFDLVVTIFGIVQIGANAFLNLAVAQALGNGALPAG